MNSIQRVLAALTFGKSQHGKPDRVPMLPVPLMQGALVHKCSVREYFHMPAEKIADAQIALNEMLDGLPDAVAGIPNVIEDATAFGVDLTYHYENSTPSVDGLRIEEYAEIDDLVCPSPDESPVLRKTRDTIALLRKRIGNEKVVIGACIAPFSLPSMLMGTSRWMRLLYTTELRDRYFRRIIDVCSDFVAKWATMQIQAGAHVIVLADGMASATMLPRSVFERYALPVIRNIIGRIPGLVAYEAVGRVEPFADLLIDSGAVALLIGEEDNIASCRRALRGKVGLIGNVNNMKMRRWSPARVELQAKAALNAGMPGYGFALANQGPEIPFDVSVETIASFVKAIAKYGRYESAPAAA